VNLADGRGVAHALVTRLLRALSPALVQGFSLPGRGLPSRMRSLTPGHLGDGVRLILRTIKGLECQRARQMIPNSHWLTIGYVSAPMEKFAPERQFLHKAA
jgi:hypothetical protein